MNASDSFIEEEGNSGKQTFAFSPSLGAESMSSKHFPRSMSPITSVLACRAESWRKHSCWVSPTSLASAGIVLTLVGDSKAAKMFHDQVSLHCTCPSVSR